MYKLKKSLGQHFLKDEAIITRILENVNKTPGINLLEIGPGGGALTKHLSKIPGINFKAVELDEEKAYYLIKQYPELEGKVIMEDFLQMKKPFDEPFNIVGNFPYNISTEILFKVLEWKDSVPEITGMFQKEVAERVASGPGNKVYGVTSVLIQPFYDILYLFDVPPESFTPPPKVNSGVIKLIRKENTLDVKSARAYIVLVKTAFNQRRKMLRNAVKSLFDAEILADPIFEKRAEALSIEDFAELTFKMK